MAVPKCTRADRPISVSAVPSGLRIDISRSCRLLGALLGALGGLPGGLCRFLPCRIGAHHCRLRSIGWEQCDHGLTSMPLEVSHAGFLDLYWCCLNILKVLVSLWLLVRLTCVTVHFNFSGKSPPGAFFRVKEVRSNEEGWFYHKLMNQRGLAESADGTVPHLLVAWIPALQAGYLLCRFNLVGM